MKEGRAKRNQPLRTPRCDGELLRLMRPMTADEVDDRDAGYPASGYRRRSARRWPLVAANEPALATQGEREGGVIRSGSQDRRHLGRNGS
jgi:hypothetical protein